MSEELLTTDEERLLVKMLSLFVFITFGFGKMNPIVCIANLFQTTPERVLKIYKIMESRGIMKDGKLVLKEIPDEFK